MLIERERVCVCVCEREREREREERESENAFVCLCARASVCARVYVCVYTHTADPAAQPRRVRAIGSTHTTRNATRIDHANSFLKNSASMCT